MNAKPFIVVVIFILFIALFAGGAMSTADLTPDTPPAASGASSDNLFLSSSGAASGSGSGVCGSVYTIRAGDTLSQIARSCGVKLADIIAANPNIVDPNLIHPGQKLAIYYNPIDTSSPVVAGASKDNSDVSVPPAAAPTAKPTSAPVTVPTAEPQAAPTASEKDLPLLPTSPPKSGIPVSGLRAGGSVNIVVRGLPASSRVDVSIGKVGSVPMKVDERDTEPDGTLNLTVTIPTKAKPDEKWVVTVTSQSKPQVKITSPVFTIQR